jgi:hypothetical protein
VIQLTNILNEGVKDKKVSFEEFNKDTILSYPSKGWDKNGNALVDITLKSKPNANFTFKYFVKGVKLDNYLENRKIKMPIQIKKHIYNNFYK